MYARPEIDGQTTTLGVSGMLWRDALIMYDRASKSLWSQVLGEAVAGPETGRKLEEIPSELTTWADWKTRYPDTYVLAKPELPGSNYELYHRDSVDIGVKGTRNPDRRLPGKSLVVGLEDGEKTATVPLEHLWYVEPVMNTEAFGKPVVIATQPEQVSAHAFIRRNGDRTLTFEPAEGRPYRARDKETGSTWDLVEGVAMDGELTGAMLKRVEGTTVYWGIWAQFHPETVILAEEPTKKQKKAYKKQQK